MSRHRVGEDSLDRIERQLAIEEALAERIEADKSLSDENRERLIRELYARMDDDEFWNGEDWDDGDTLGIFVRKLGPKGPTGSAGIALRPETEFCPQADDMDAAPRLLPFHRSSGEPDSTLLGPGQ